ncbi:hypothetical protein A3J17_04070 [Candidatus Curtissbacteria bacterium RIFCSPLOWO2_02_FULL_40_11]|uniref:Cytotoxin n=1 Tax=Candidatus Curtissbacteria bacterium RIFCSPLOWO2_12_FULL_38_9 TaxID=1797735 RepID=A0A1F5I731_9BACT|nr:MAG: hypothetical protein A3J17_04070 [Candidatus Curtissbacteria bacterium RIFCSPLOWO2_02_FULL_40_11]OGE12196.1 MAG: hypothetical protein A3G14_01360 [Candidatus Curtissbacteria bacterium RIFCSPLOWO2_12_FULL_38_9]
MYIAKTKNFTKLYQKLPKNIQKKADKQIIFLSKNLFHPSLNTKKMKGINRWEVRVDKNYRFTFEKINEVIMLKTIGPHDIGLGEK